MTLPPRDPQDGVLIAIPTLNEAAHIQSVVENLLDNAPPHTRLVVVDGGSTDGTRDIVERMEDPRVHVIHNADRIQSAGINLAVAAAAAEARYLLRADAHAVYPRGFISALLDDMRQTRASAVAVGMNTISHRGFGAGVAAAQNSRLGTGGAAHRVGLGGRFVEHGHHALIKMDAFRAVGGYDATQSHNEDAEFDYRLTRHGGRIWLTGRTQIGYYPRKTARSLFVQYFRFGKGRAETILKHAIAPRLRQTLPLLTVPATAFAIVAGPAAVLSGSLGWLLLLLPALIWAVLCTVYGAKLAIKARRADVLWAGPAAMLMHLGWSLGFVWRTVTWPASPKVAGGSLRPMAISSSPCPGQRRPQSER